MFLFKKNSLCVELNTKNYVFYLSLLFMMVMSCKSVERFDTYKGRVPERTKQDILKAITQNNPEYQFLEEKIRITGSTEDYEGSADLTLRIAHDEKIWAVMKKLGFEAGRMMATKDSIFLINRLEKSYLGRSMNKLHHLTGYAFSFMELEEMLTGTPSQMILEAASYRQEGNACILEYRDQRGSVAYKFNAYNMLPEGILLNDGRGRFAEINYLSYLKKNGSYFPIEIEILLDSPDIQAEARLEVKEIIINAPKEMTFSIPSRYEEITW